MEKPMIITLYYLVGITLFLGLNELAYRKLKLKGEISRKLAHFASTLAILPFPYILPSHWYGLILSIIFFLVLLITQQQQQLKSIHDIERKSMGSYLLPLSIYLVLLIAMSHENEFLFVLPILILAVCDPLAAIVGMSVKRYNRPIVIVGIDTKKSMLGSLSFFISGFIISLVAIYYHRMAMDTKTLWLALAIAIVSTLAELISWRGSDNLTIPMSVLLMLIFLL